MNQGLESDLSCVLLDGSGAVLIAENAERPHNQASLSKMMTLYLTLGIRGFTTVSPRAAKTPGSRMGLAAGQRISITDLILGMIVASANDAATAIAEHCGPDFVDRMNAKAREFGLAATQFNTPSGISPGQTATALDMARLAFRLHSDRREFMGLFGIGSFCFNGRRIRNRNSLLFKYKGLTGLKTGTTLTQRRHLAATVQRNGTQLLGLVMGCKTRAERDEVMTVLLDRGFEMAADTTARGNVTEADLV